jgi:hypothetical protein
LWTVDNPTGGTNTFVAIDAAGLSRLTAAGRFGTAWTGTSGTVVGEAICGGSSGFMVVRPSFNTAYYTSNGTSWVTRTLPASNNWQGVATNGTRFVVIARGTNIARYSDDKGVTWNNATLPASINWSAITCNQATGVWIAVANGSNTIARSTDGATWTSVTAPSSSPWSCITSTNTTGGTFVALAQSSSAVMYSTNGGTSWSASTGLSALNYKIAYGAGLFVSASRNTSNYATSPDGITWTARTPPTLNGGMSAIAYGNGRFITVGNNDQRSYYSTNGINWTAGATLPSDAFGSVGIWIDIAFA